MELGDGAPPRIAQLPVEEVSDHELLGAYADECERKYDWRPDEGDLRTGLHLALRPRMAYAWLEKDYPRTATRFSFG